MISSRTYLLLAQVLAVQWAVGRADVHQRLLECREVALHEGETQVEHRVRRRRANLLEGRRDALPRLVHH